MNKRIQSWCDGCATSRRQWNTLSAGLASKKLNLTEARNLIIVKECLAVLWGIKRFKLYLAGRIFMLQTYHKSLRYLKDAAYQNDRVLRWAVAVLEDISVKRTWELIPD